MYRTGIGPSSSHTVGPMRAGRRFIRNLKEKGLFNKVQSLKVYLLGSLAATGVGHATDKAVLLGLMGKAPSDVPIDLIDTWIQEIHADKKLFLDSTQKIDFDYDKDLIFDAATEDPYHTNCMVFKAFDGAGSLLYEEKIYSTGGGFIETEEEVRDKENKSVLKYKLQEETKEVPYPYTNANEMIALCKQHNLSIAQLVRANELTFRSEEVLNADLDSIWSVMRSCIDRGLSSQGCLPGPKQIKRRAHDLYTKLKNSKLTVAEDPLQVIDWINVFAFAVSEENASGGRIVTSPTNGAAGVIPAVINYYRSFVSTASVDGIRDFLLVAGAIGALYKQNASISGAEVGCQGEIGVACSMAAAGLAAALGATNEQIENAAEIGMEHHLGLTCDPVDGQVQIPCIERNAVAAVKAVNSVRLSMMGNGSHYVSLDQVIKTMLQTGKDMKSKYKETSLGGLAVCVVEC